MIKAITTCSLALAFCTCISTNAAAQDLQGRWALSIRDLSHKEIVKLTIRFSGEQGQSCIGGDWKKVVVESAKSSKEDFFPVSDALTYQFNGSDLVIGRNGICDGYLRLSGKFDGKLAKGAYYAFGTSGGPDLGDFSLERSR